MKTSSTKMFLLASLVLSSALPVMAAETISDVTICAARCNSESLNVRSHSDAVVGKIFYAPATSGNRGNTSFCLSNAKSIELHSDRLTDSALETCVNVLAGKYFGKKVDIVEGANEVAADESYFQIRVTK